MNERIEHLREGYTTLNLNYFDFFTSLYLQGNMYPFLLFTLEVFANQFNNASSAQAAHAQAFE